MLVDVISSLVLEQLPSRGSFSDGKMRLVSFSSYDDRES